MVFSFTDVIQLITIFQVSILASLILNSRNKSKSDYLLATIFFGFSFQTLCLFLHNRDVMPLVLNGIIIILGYLFGPLVYLYIRSITRKSYDLLNKRILHFAPVSILLLAALVMKENLDLYLIWILFYVHITIYLAISFREIHIYKNTIRNNYSRLESLNLKWLYWVISTNYFNRYCSNRIVFVADRYTLK